MAILHGVLAAEELITTRQSKVDASLAGVLGRQASP
jgi:hypothetical protein